MLGSFDTYVWAIFLITLVRFVFFMMLDTMVRIFGHTHKFSAWNSHKKYDFCNTKSRGNILESSRNVNETTPRYMRKTTGPWWNGWVNKSITGDLRRHRAYYDVPVMIHYWRIERGRFMGKTTRQFRDKIVSALVCGHLAGANGVAVGSSLARSAWASGHQAIIWINAGILLIRT